MASPKTYISPVEDSHAQMLAVFFRCIWDATATPESIIASRATQAAENQSEPGKPLPAAVAIQGERIIGYCGSIAVRWWDGASECSGYWAKGFMVLPEFRNGPLGFMILKELSRSSPLMAAMTVNPASNRLFAAQGYRDMGPLPNRVRPLSVSCILGHIDLQQAAAGRIPHWVARTFRLLQHTRLPTLAGLLADLALRGLSPKPDVRLRIDFDATVDETQIDDLWQHCRTAYLAAPVRDGKAMLLRYDSNSRADNKSYCAVAVYRDNTLRGLAWVRRPREQGDPRLGGLRMASLSDLLVQPDDLPAINALLAAAEACAASLGAEAILCSASHIALAKALRRRRYVSIAANVHFFMRGDPASGAWPSTVDQWWLARGDSEADAVF
jgi:hypothetical protein